tara:strand:- start:134 stop:445 length:312 start_codon:yes stop_codon:yes gene_type:complete
MSKKIEKTDGQEVIVVEQKTSTFTKHSDNEGHAISSVKIQIDGLEISISKHSINGVLSDSGVSINIHDIGKASIAIHEKIVKKQLTRNGHTWTNITPKNMRVV